MAQESATRDNVVKKLKWAQRGKELRPLEELRTGCTAQLEDALAELAELAQTINMVEMVTAINHNQERDAWLERALQGKFTTPKLRYNDELLKQTAWSYDRIMAFDAVAEKVKAAVAALPDEPVGNTWRQLTEARLQDVTSAFGLAHAMIRHDAMYAKRSALEIYGLPNHSLVQRAKRDIEARKSGMVYHGDETILTETGRKQLAEIKLDAEAVRRVFLWAAEQYGLAESRPIIISDQVTAIDVRDAALDGPAVMIPADYTTNALRVIPLVVHEVGCHWRDSENMQRVIPWVGAGALKAMDEVLYEGHAVSNAFDTDLLTQGYVRESRRLYYPVAITYTYRRKAVFRETAKMLYELVKSDIEPAETTLRDVWQVTYRVFRGNPRPNVQTGYVYGKDRAYYAGRILVQGLNRANLGYLADYGTLTVKDLLCLAQNFQLQPEKGLPYPAQKDFTRKLCEELLKGC